MAIVRAAFASLSPVGPAPRAKIVAVPADVADFLEEHVAKLVSRGESDDAPPGSFQNGAGQRFADLAGAADGEFEALATSAAGDIQHGMDNRANAGLFVALQVASDGGGSTLALLKLDATHSGAQLRSDGAVPLAMVRNLVDQPGDLQMGAVYPDARAASDVIVGKRLRGTASAYFLDGLGISQMENAKTAAKEIVKTVFRLKPDKAPAIASRLAASQATSVNAFLKEVPRDELDPLERQQLQRDFQRRTWPIDRIAPAHVVVRHVMQADGITISGTADDMKRVRLTDLKNGRWKAEIEFSGRPRESFD